MEEARVARDLQTVLKKNRELRQEVEKKRGGASHEKIRMDLEAEMSRLRQLPYQRPIEYRQMQRSELRDYIGAQMRSQYSAEELHNYELALTRLGLLPRGTNLGRLITDLLSEQIAAFYDMEKHQLCTFEGLDLKDNMERMILAHELIHVLQDQNFDLRTLPLKSKSNDDAALAAAALVEGDANYHMGVYLKKSFNVQQFFRDLKYLFAQRTDRLLAAPPYLRDTLLFPYQEGQMFVAELHARGGEEAIDRAFTHPPQSTEQILHFQKYLGPVPDPPKPVVLDPKIDPYWRKIYDNVVGELGIRSYFTPLLGANGASAAAAGWGGDRCQVYEVQNLPDRWVLLWKSVWDTPPDARKFFNALLQQYDKKYDIPKTVPPASTGKTAEPRVDAVFFSVANQKQCIVLRGDTVWLIDVPDAATIKSVVQDLVGKIQ